MGAEQSDWTGKEQEVVILAARKYITGAASLDYILQIIVKYIKFQ